MTFIAVAAGKQGESATLKAVLRTGLENPYHELIRSMASSRLRMEWITSTGLVTLRLISDSSLSAQNICESVRVLMAVEGSNSAGLPAYLFCMHRIFPRDPERTVDTPGARCSSMTAGSTKSMAVRIALLSSSRSGSTPLVSRVVVYCTAARQNSCRTNSLTSTKSGA